jgi:ankyrin repeat protein
MSTDSDRAAELLALALAGDDARLRALLPSAGDVMENCLPETPAGITALMSAAVGGNEATVELLLQCGADPSRRDTQGRSAAAYARAGGHPHLAERLDIVVDIEKTM